MTDYNLIDRITAIKLELEYESNNIFSILIALRNILHNSDEMTYNEIRDILIEYFQINPDSRISENLINLVTNPNTSGNNSVMMMGFHYFNNLLPNQVVEANDSDDDIESDSDSILTDTDSEIIDNINNDNVNNDNFINNNLNHHHPINNIYYEYLNNLFYGSGNIHYNMNNYPLNNIHNNNSNNINTLLNLSNLSQPNLNGINSSTDNGNFFASLFNMAYSDNVNNQQNNEDIPLVITDDSFNNLRKCTYESLEEDIKKINTKSMITLEEFKNEDIVIVLPCKHVFLEEEITNWLKENSHKCPSCRNSCGNYYAKIS